MPSSAYTAQAEAFTKRVQWLVEIDIDECSLNYTTAPCTATDAGDGMRCYNTYGTCQDPANYSATIRTLRFCLHDVPWPDLSTPAYPYLLELVAVPQKIDPAKLYVYPEKVTVKMLADWSTPALNNDKALFNTSSVGEFWRNFMARNRNYPGKPMRIKRGFYADGFALADFDQVGPEYKIREVQVGRDGVSITAESPLADLNKTQVPFPISDDNTVQDVGGINGSVTTVTVLDAFEYPDPADYTRNVVYVKIENEICSVTARDTGTHELTIVRGQLGTSATTHAAGIKVQHVAFFGTAPSSPANVYEVMQDLLEWAGVAAADVNTTSFDDSKATVWSGDDIKRTVVKPEKIAKLLQQIRESRGIVIYLDSAGEWSARVMYPNTDATEITEDLTILDSVEVFEDEELRVTRVAVFYDPNTDDPKQEVEDYDSVVYVIDAGLEDANNFGEKKELRLFAPWLDPAHPLAQLRQIAARHITRNRYGVRTIRFRLDVRESALNVGDAVAIQTRHVLDRDGNQEGRYCVITARSEHDRSQTKYDAVDVNYSGAYLRFGPDTMDEDYDDATALDRSYGYWGDDDNRVGSTRTPGYVFA